MTQGQYFHRDCVVQHGNITETMISKAIRMFICVFMDITFLGNNSDELSMCRGFASKES